MTGKGETQLQTAIVKALRQMGVWVIRTSVSAKRSSVGSAAGEPGLPDLWLPELGLMEVKMPDGVLSSDQKTWHAKAERHGLNVETVRSVEQAVRVVMEWRQAKLSQLAPRRRF